MQHNGFEVGDECGPVLKCRRAAQLLHNCVRTGVFQAKHRLLSPPYVIESEQQAQDGFILLNEFGDR